MAKKLFAGRFKMKSSKAQLLTGVRHEGHDGNAQFLPGLDTSLNSLFLYVFVLFVGFKPDTQHDTAPTFLSNLQPSLTVDVESGRNCLKRQNSKPEAQETLQYSIVCKPLEIYTGLH